MMQKLDEKEWGAVSLTSIFTFERGKEKNMASLAEGNIPLVSARNVNNGIKGFVSNPTKVFKGGNVLSLNNDGDGGAGLAYYQPLDFALDTHVTALYPKYTVPLEALIYITASISKQHSVFGHGRSISMPRARRIQDMLPTNDDNQPDFDYMAQYTRDKNGELLSRYMEYVTRRLSELEYKDITALSEKAWGKFKAFGKDGLFIIATTNSSIDAIRLVDGADKLVPYVTRTDTNNGISRFVSADNLSSGYDEAGCITIGLDTQTAFWQSCDFVTGQNIQVITGKRLNSFSAQFIIPQLIRQMRAKFNWGGNGATLGRMKRLELMLPINDSGNPDYDYMKQYTKNMMIRKYQQYLAFLKRKEQAPRSD